MKKFNDFTNESIRDKMSPVSEEDIRVKMGDEKYHIYRLYTDAMNSLKEPFEMMNNYDFDMFGKSKNKKSFEVRFWWVYFDIFYDDGMWTCTSKYNDKKQTYQFENWDDIYEVMKEDIKKSFNKETKYMEKEIKRSRDKIISMEKDLSILYKL